jgi:hypothetical protein
MSKVRKIVCSSLECSLFDQIALFSTAGLSVSLALVLAYDLRMDSWA